MQDLQQWLLQELRTRNQSFRKFSLAAGLDHGAVSRYLAGTRPTRHPAPRVSTAPAGRTPGRHTRAVGRRHRREGNEQRYTVAMRLVRCNSIGCRTPDATETVGHFRSHLASTSHPYHRRPSFGHVQLLDTSRKSGSVSEPR